MRNKWLFPFIGLAAVIWLLIRVIPKPSRASYPCQRVALPLAASFVAWVSTAFLSFAAFRKARLNFRNARWVLGVVSLIAGVVGTIAITREPVQADTPNTPIGTAFGIHPGRVVWTHHPGAAAYNGSGYWWADSVNDQAAIDQTVVDAVLNVSGQADQAAAWDALCRSHNNRWGKGDHGYQAGELFAIKINQNNKSSQSDNNQIDASPQVVLAVVKSLVAGGIPASAITVFDASRFITNNIYNKVHTDYPSVVLMDHSGGNGRVASGFVTNRIPYSHSTGVNKNISTAATNAAYLIDLAIMKGHVDQGVTFCGKNWFGALGINSAPSGNNHDYFTGGSGNGYLTFVDWLGHKDLGGKTVLFMVDNLYATQTVNEVPSHRWTITPFNNSWPSSLLASQDPVAVDSVAMDFFKAEFPGAGYMTYADKYLHEAALANNPPSGTFYDPEQDGTRLPSLGVHEQWNNVTAKQYTRNLGTGNGIELIYVNSGGTPQTLTVQKSGTGTGTVTSSPAGINCGATCSATFSTNTVVTLTATPDSGMMFSGWSGDCSGTGTCTLTMSGAKTAVATFATQTPQTLTVTKAGTGTGTVTSSPAGISCGSTCSATFAGGSLVSLTPTPDSGMVFAGWSGDCTGTGACSVTMNGPRNVTATFNTRCAYPTCGTPAAIPGTIQAENFDQGGEGVAYHDTTSGNTGGQYRTSDNVDIEATTDTGGGYNVGWIATGEWLEYSVNVASAGTYDLNIRVATGDTANPTKTLHFNVDGVNVTGTISFNQTGGFQTWTTITKTGVSLTAGAHVVRMAFDSGNFNVNWFQFSSTTPQTLTVTKAGSGTGTVTSSPAGINCGSTCSASFGNGSSVTLTATPDSGSMFTGWSGDCSGTGTCVLTMNANKSATATFAPQTTQSLTVMKAGTGTGTVTSSPAGINCGSTCSANFNTGSSVTLTVTPDSGMTFAGWSGDCSGTGTCNLTMSVNRSVTATFNTGASGNLALNMPVVASSVTGGFVATNGNDGSQPSYWESAAGAYPATLTVDLGAIQSINTVVVKTPNWGTGRTETFSVLGSTDNATFNQIVASTAYTFNTGNTSTVTIPFGVTGQRYVRLSFTANTGNPGAQVGEFEVYGGGTTRMLTVVKAGSGTGTVTSSPSGINCGSTCSASFGDGASVTLTATPDSGMVFAGWSGDCSGTGTCNLTMSANWSATATFNTGTPGNLALNMPIVASSVTGGFVATNGNDGSQPSYWESAAGAYPATLTVDLGSSQSISRVVVKTPNWGTGRTETFSVLGSTDNVTFNQIVASTAYTFNTGNTSTVTITFGATSQRYVRLSVTANTGNPGAQVGEFEVYQQ